MSAKLKKLIYSEEAYLTNLAEHVDDDDLSKIGEQVFKGYEIDKESCEDWERRTKPAMDLAMQVYKEKNFPFANASNVKYPLIATASMQFSARCLPNIIKGSDIVKAKIIGKDKAVGAVKDPKTGEPLTDEMGDIIPITKSMVADRVSKHMSYQIIEEMTGWETDLDKALVSLPIIGEEWKKTYWNSVKLRNISCRVPSRNMTINYWAKSVDDAQRITERVPIYPNNLETKKRSGYFLDIDYGDEQSAEDVEQNSEDVDSPVIFLEQHCWLDLDKDGYKEPYIVTINKASHKVARIYMRFENDKIERDSKGRVIQIEADQSFTQTVFFPSPDGGSRGMGFGNLLGSINEAINTSLNQLIDSGTLYNSNTGFIGKGAQLGRTRQGGQSNFELGEWKEVPCFGDDLRKNIVPLPVKEPSMVLFSLLGLLIDSGKQLSSVSEIMTGQAPGANTSPTTVMALAEQGLQVFSSIYKRVHRGLKEEFKKLFKLNSIYLEDEEYFTILDDEMAVAREDYDLDGIDVIPVSDPTEISEMQQALRADALGSMLGTGYNDQEIRRRRLEAMRIPEPEKLMLPDEAFGQPEPELVLKQEQLKLDWAKFEWKTITDRANMEKMLALAFKAEQEGEAVIPGLQLDEFKTQTEFLNKEAERMQNERLQGMAKQPNDQGNEKGSGGNPQIA